MSLQPIKYFILLNFLITIFLCDIGPVVSYFNFDFFITKQYRFFNLHQRSEFPNNIGCHDVFGSDDNGNVI